MPDRCAFPPLCKPHYNNLINTIETWIEPADNDFISATKPFLSYIPKPYLAFCKSCSKCGGFALGQLQDSKTPADDKIEDEIANRHYLFNKNKIEFCNLLYTTEEFCKGRCWDGGYFRKWNHKYSRFFIHFLHYCSENDECDCFWPEWNDTARSIKDLTYLELKDFCDQGLITPDFSNYWIATRNPLIEKHCSDYLSIKKLDFVPCCCIDYYSTIDKSNYKSTYTPNSHGMASSLVTYAFFYSQYHQLLLNTLEFIQKNDRISSIEIDRIYKLLETIRNEFEYLYENCLDSHPHPKIYYERGLLNFHSGNFEKALEDIEFLIEMASEGDITLSSDIYQQEGSLYAELGKYDLAIKALDEAIRLNPENAQAYFERAFCYFEKGDFTLALNDYLNSKANKKTPLRIPAEFLQSLLNGVKDGGIEAASDYFPSMLHSLYGINRCLWSLIKQPTETTYHFANCCYDSATASYEYLRSIDAAKLEGYYDEFNKLYSNFEQLSEAEKGQLIGYSIGKYGIEFFGTGVLIKGIDTFRKLREANRILNFESMIASEIDKDILIKVAKQHAKDRELFFKNVKLHVDLQNKHVIGAHNYEPGKSILTHKDPEALINKFAGKGIPVKERAPGLPDFRETVNFGECIGYHVNKTNGIQTKTTFGEIRYSKTGAHIVPVLPK